MTHNQIALLQEKIEAVTKDNIPSFMWYSIDYREPVGFTVELRFSDYQGRLFTSEDFLPYLAEQLKESIHKLKWTLTPEEATIWNWLETGETTAEVWAVDKIRDEYEIGLNYLDDTTTKVILNLSCYHLRDKTIWAAYSEDKNILAYMEGIG